MKTVVRLLDSYRYIISEFETFEIIPELIAKVFASQGKLHSRF